MIQPNAVMRPNVLLVIAAVMLIALAGMGLLPRLIATGGPPISVVHAQPVAPRPAVEPAAIPGTCGAGAYVSGDLVGEASPAAVYTTMCSSR
jgi:hypothetical protein